ncbi:MAG: enoyl-CoA hydratase-related protein [Myxococcota bacterium]|jgi:enoyl-CoA hydratase/carnithine racemase
MGDPLVLSARDGAVGYVTLNRPSAMNAFNLPLALEFIKAVEDLDSDVATRVIVINGAGKVFSAGGDVREMHGNVLRGDRAAYFREPLAAFNRMAMAARNARTPVIASVHGAAAGVAFNLVLSCDLRVAAEGTKFAQAFIGIGLSPDGGGTFVLPRLLGQARAAELTMLPGGIDAAKALEWGLVNRVVPAALLKEKTEELAREIARGPADALARTKALLNGEIRDALERRMEDERLAQIANSVSDDFPEGLSAFLEKRKPVFGGRGGK